MAFRCRGRSSSASRRRSSRRSNAGARPLPDALLRPSRDELGRRLSSLPVPVHHRRRPLQLCPARQLCIWSVTTSTGSALAGRRCSRSASSASGKGIGWSMVIFLAALQFVPLELKEAAAVDGAKSCRAVPCRVAAVYPSRARLRHRDARHRQLLRLHLRLPDYCSGPLDETQVLRRTCTGAFSFLDFGYGSALCVHSLADRVRALARRSFASSVVRSRRAPDGLLQLHCHFARSGHTSASARCCRRRDDGAVRVHARDLVLAVLRSCSRSRCSSSLTIRRRPTTSTRRRRTSSASTSSSRSSSPS